MLGYLTLPVTPFQQNCSIVWCDPSMEAALIDPGGDLPAMRQAVQRLGVDLLKILLHPAHIDHAGGSAELAREAALPIVGPHPADQCWIDVLFAGSMGRTDFPGGDHDTLLSSIGQRLWPIGDDTVFIPGHRPESTFGAERRSNPYVGGT